MEKNMKFKKVSLTDFKKMRLAYRLNNELKFQIINKSEIDKFNDAKLDLLAEMETEKVIVEKMTLDEFQSYKKMNFKI